MIIESQATLITQLTEELLREYPAYFLVTVKISPSHQVKVYVDGDEGITIEKCSGLNRALYKKIEAAGCFPPGDFSLELSSPGLDEPLKLHRQYVKNIGRPVEVSLLDGRTVSGTLVAVTPEQIEIEEIKGKAKSRERVVHPLPFSNIKTTRLQVVFKKNPV